MLVGGSSFCCIICTDSSFNERATPLHVENDSMPAVLKVRCEMGGWDLGDGKG